MSKVRYDSTIARIAGNILSGERPGHRIGDDEGQQRRVLVRWAVALAREIVAEVKRTEPQEDREP